MRARQERLLALLEENEAFLRNVARAYTRATTENRCQACNRVL